MCSASLFGIRYDLGRSLIVEPRTVVAWHRAAWLAAEWQILFDTINVGWSDEHCFAQRPAAFGTFALKQMASARTPEKDFAGAGDLETFGY